MTVTNQKWTKEPAAVLPVIMSVAALGIVVLHIARFGAAREADEGTSAHLWQLLMAAQLPIIGYFAIKWLGETPRQALIVIAIQLVAILAAMAPVFILGL